MLIPFATRPAQPMYCRFTPAVASPAFSWPGLVHRPDHQAAPPAAAPGRLLQARPPRTGGPRSSPRTCPSDARFSSRCVRSGVRSPACSAIVHPFRLGSSLTSADTYLPACSHVSVRAKHGRSSPSSSARFRQRQPGPYPGSSSRLRFCCPHKHMIARRLRCAKPLLSAVLPGFRSCATV